MAVWLGITALSLVGMALSAEGDPLTANFTRLGRFLLGQFLALIVAIVVLVVSRRVARFTLWRRLGWLPLGVSGGIALAIVLQAASGIIGVQE